MADLVIRGLWIPKERSLWLCIKTDGTVYNIKPGGIGTAHAVGTAVPLPKGHGRLMDAERFRVILCRLKERQNDDVATHALNWAIECLDKLDTIVPAEGGTEDA